jgi:hypothetical protein
VLWPRSPDLSRTTAWACLGTACSGVVRTSLLRPHYDRRPVSRPSRTSHSTLPDCASPGRGADQSARPHIFVLQRSEGKRVIPALPFGAPRNLTSRQ